MRLVDVHDAEIAQTQLGEELRKLRKRARRTNTYVARKSRLSTARISRIENGQVPVTPEELELLVDLLDASQDEYARIIDLREAGSQTRDELIGVAPEIVNNALHRIELETTVRRGFNSTIVQGLLQTAAYIERVLLPNCGQEQLAAAVQARLSRQSVLFDRSKQFWFVLTESAFCEPFLPKDLRRMQLRHIASMSTLPNVNVGVIPNYRITKSSLQPS